MNHDQYMQAAINEARKAEAIQEVPIGAVIVKDGEIIGRGYNLRESTHDPTAHAEMIAIRMAAEWIDDWRLEDCTLYVTLEPCPMCAGAIIQSRIDQCVYATPDPKAGCVDTLMQLLQEPRFNHQTQVIRGIRQEECTELLRSFFSQLRAKKKQLKRSLSNDCG